MRGSGGNKGTEAADLRAARPVTRLVPPSLQLDWRAAEEGIKGLTTSGVNDAAVLLFAGLMPDLFPAMIVEKGKTLEETAQLEIPERDDDVVLKRVRELAEKDLWRIREAVDSGHDQITPLQPDEGVSYRFEASTDPDSLFQAQLRLGALGVLATAGLELG